MAKSIIPDVIEAASNRRSFVQKIGIATAAVGAAVTLGANKAEAQTSTDIYVLNFALNLEYLEAEFYTYATTGNSITALGLGIDGVANPGNSPSGGEVTGGQQVNFSNNLVFSQAVANQIAADERAHVVLLRGALGSLAIARPALNLNALGFGFGSQNDFLKLARIFEDIGVTAYAGAAPLLSAPILATAAKILAAEAFHVSNIRAQIARLNIPTGAPLDGVDLLPPPTDSHYFTLDANGLCATRTPGQVLFLAFGGVANTNMGGFFPNGVNGYFTTSSASA